MNRPIVRLYGLVVVLFALLVGFTSRWTIFQAAALRENPLNQRMRLEQQRVDRGPILASDGAVLARSVRAGEGYERRYPTGAEFAQAIGYSYVDLGRAGLELYRNAPLEGQTSSGLQTILDELQGRSDGGDEVVTTLDPAAQQAALAALGAHEGAVVALDPRSGAVRVMASTPSYDPNDMRSPASREARDRRPGSPAGQPRDRVRVRAGVDVQGRDRDGRDRHGSFHALLDVERA